MERREQLRVEVPLEIDLEHPSLGRTRCRVRDVSQSGMFIECSGHLLQQGARVRIKPVVQSMLGHEHTPTVELEVARCETDGIGTSFPNRTQAYLFSSFRQRRTQLAIGVDYFQVFVGALLFNQRGALLVVDENGRWLFPGTYLQVGTSIEAALTDTLSAELDLTLDLLGPPVANISLASGVSPESATVALFHRCEASGEARVRSQSRFRRLRWLAPGRNPGELPFADPYLLELARNALGIRPRP